MDLPEFKHFSYRFLLTAGAGSIVTSPKSAWLHQAAGTCVRRSTLRPPGAWAKLL